MENIFEIKNLSLNFGKKKVSSIWGEFKTFVEPKKIQNKANFQGIKPPFAYLTVAIVVPIDELILFVAIQLITGSPVKI